MTTFFARLFRTSGSGSDRAAQDARPAGNADAPGRDFSLYSGERQIAGRYEDIRLDHRNRYEWALQFLPKHGTGMDIFCGNGYGTRRLAEDEEGAVARTVLGIDASAEAIAFAKTHYAAPGVTFRVGVYPFDIPVGWFDFVVSLESIEHIEPDARFFADLAHSLLPGGVFVFSVPCETHLPLRFANREFHFRHYEHDAILQLIAENGLEVIGWAGQNTYVLDENGIVELLPDEDCFLAPETLAQFVVFAARKPTS